MKLTEREIRALLLATLRMEEVEKVDIEFYRKLAQRLRDELARKA